MLNTEDKCVANKDNSYARDRVMPTTEKMHFRNEPVEILEEDQRPIQL